MLERFENRIINKRGISPIKKMLENFNEGKGNISSLPSSGTGRFSAGTGGTSADTDRISVGTTLFKKDVRPKLKQTKRKIIMDRDITPTIFEKLKKKCVQDSYTLSQKSIIEILYPLGISNITISRVINELLPEAKSTQGSVASMIRFIKNQYSSKQMANELDRLLNSEGL